MRTLCKAKSITKRQILYDSSYVRHPVKFIDTEAEWYLWGMGGGKSYCLMVKSYRISVLQDDGALGSRGTTM